MTRGDLAWLITIPRDGSLALDGVVPALIQWPPGRHPASTLDDPGCALVKLQVCHPEPARISALLANLQLTGGVDVVPLPASRSGHLIAHIDTRHGRRVLSGAAGAVA
jgi:Glyoxalase-like domain